MPATAVSTQKKVLVAQPDPQRARQVAELLSLRGIEVIVAREGREALQKILSESPDAVLLDSTLPGIGKMEICDLLKNNPATREIPVGLLKGDAETDGACPHQQAGALLVIPKPFKPQQLLTSVELLLSAHRREPGD